MCTTLQTFHSAGHSVQVLPLTPSSDTKARPIRSSALIRTVPLSVCVFLQSFDNEPYVGYVRDDRGFANHFIGQTFESLSQTDQDAPPTEGVSGATMTSQTIAQAIITAAHSAHEAQPASSFLKGLPSRLRDIDAPQWGALLLVLCGLVVGFTRLRGHWVGRIVFPLRSAWLPWIWRRCPAFPSTTLGLGNSWYSSGRPGAAAAFYRCDRNACHYRS